MWNSSQKWRLRPVKAIVILIAGAGLFGCAAPPPAKVVERDQPPSQRIVTHRVSAGETLYSIAWRYGLNHKKLARHNAIPPPYKIYEDQTLRLDVHRPERRVKPPSPPPQVAVKPKSRPDRSSEENVSRSKKRTPAVAPAPKPKPKTSNHEWRWPAKGRVVSAFGASTGLNQGIDIDGELGEPVLAAASGRVVYAGSGLRGYGNLLIIKHSDMYLSAYAHNDRILFDEGDAVKAGDKIAEMGSSGTNKVRLHFEIRRDGQPVDPIRYLPKR